MNIGIDLRSLASGTVSGVENYCLNLVEHLLQADQRNRYYLFCSGLTSTKLPDFSHVNSQQITSRWPNRLLNLAFKTNALKLEKIIGQKLDWLLMPNLNQVSILPQTKLAITVHDLSPVLTPEFYDIKRRLWHRFLSYRRAYGRADVLFAVSESTKRDLTKVYGVDPKKVTVAYPGVDVPQLQQSISQIQLREARNVYGLPGDYILFLNTVEPRKNLQGLIRAFEQLSQPISLVIAGRLGWKYRQDLRLIRQSKKSAKIKLVGYIEEAHKPAVIKLAKALIYPSFYEGFGFQPLEAFAVGTPVVASQVSSIPEVVKDAALLINPYDSSSIARAINSLLIDANLRSFLINKGHTQAKHFNWRQTAKIVLAKIQEVANG